MVLSSSLLREAAPEAGVVVSPSSLDEIVQLKGVVSGEDAARLDLQKIECEISIDSRTTKPGNIFVALCGECHNGHHFVKEALSYGAVGAIIAGSEASVLDISSPGVLQNKIIVVVPETGLACVDLARAWRETFGYPIVGMTGSVGKTTTKEMIKYIFARAELPSCVSNANQNTPLGAAINLSRLNSTHRCGVFELGISHKGDMDELVDLVRPTVAVLTCVTNAHNEWLGSLQEIVHEKSKVFRHVPSDGARIINGDQPELKNLKTKNTITFGFSKGCDVTATEIKKCVDENNEPVTTGVFRVHGNYVPLKLRGHHDGVLLNSLAAAATANYLGCSNNDIVAGLWDFKTVQGRGAVKKIADGLGFVIDDCYNAHALSVCAALRSLDSIPGKRKIAVLGDLYEQGYRTYEAHHEVAQCLGSTKSISHVIILGDAMTEAARKFSCGTKIFSVASWQEALQRTKALLVSDSRVLLKASGRLGLTNIVNALIEK